MVPSLKSMRLLRKDLVGKTAEHSCSAADTVGSIDRHSVSHGANVNNLPAYDT